MKPLLSVGVIAMAIAGVAAYAVTAVISEANLRMGTVAKNPVDAIQKGLTALKTDRRMLDGALVLVSSWQADRDEPAEHLSDPTSDSVAWPVALLQADDEEDPAKAAILAHKVTSVSREPLETPAAQRDTER